MNLFIMCNSVAFNSCLVQISYEMSLQFGRETAYLPRIHSRRRSQSLEESFEFLFLRKGWVWSQQLREKNNGTSGNHRKGLSRNGAHQYQRPTTHAPPSLHPDGTWHVICVILLMKQSLSSFLSAGSRGSKDLEDNNFVLK